MSDKSNELPRSHWHVDDLPDALVLWRGADHTGVVYERTYVAVDALLGEFDGWLVNSPGFKEYQDRGGTLGDLVEAAMEAARNATAALTGKER